MAALGSTRSDRSAFPLSNPPFCNSNAFWPSKPSPSIHSLNASDSQKIRRPMAAASRPSQIGADRNTAARAEDNEFALPNNDDESDDDFPSIESLSRAALRPKISIEASKTRSTLRRPEQPALQGPAHQGGSRDQPVILDINDDLDEADARGEAEGTSSDVDISNIERDASLHDTLAASEFASAPIKSVDASGLWYDVEEDCYIEDPAPRLGPHRQHSIPSALAQTQPHTLSQSSAPPQQDQTNQQAVGSVARAASVEPAPHSLSKPFDSGDDGWTEEDTAELEKELDLVLEKQQVESSLAGIPTSRSPRSVEAPLVETRSRERTESISSRLEEPQDISRHGTAQGHEGELQETEVVVEGGAVAIQQQEEPGHTGVGDQHDLIEVDDAHDREDNEATEALPAAQPKIPETDEHRFRLRGVRARQLVGRQTKTTQYRVVWGKRPNRSDDWFNEDDVQISMPCEPYSQDLVLQVGSFRVCSIRSSLRKGRKVCEYLVDMLGLDSRIWTTEDQLRISLSPRLVAELKGSSPRPLSQAQRDVLLRHSTTPISDEHRHTSRASQNSSSPSDLAQGLVGDPATRKRGHQDMNTEIIKDNHYPVNTDDSHKTCDTSDEDARPAKRRKRRPTHAMTPPLHLRRSSRLPSTTRAEMNEVQSQDESDCSSTFLDKSYRHASRSSRSPSAAAEAVPVAEYREWPFQGFLKRTRVGNDVTFNLEFQLLSISEQLHLPIDPKALDIYSSKEPPAKILTDYKAAAHSKVHQAPLQPKKRRAEWTKWTPEEDARLLQMRNDGCSWHEIHKALPHRSIGATQVHYSTKLKG